jgi:hypothetical protein
LLVLALALALALVLVAAVLLLRLVLWLVMWFLLLLPPLLQQGVGVAAAMATAGPTQLQLNRPLQPGTQLRLQLMPLRHPPPPQLRQHWRPSLALPAPAAPAAPGASARLRARFPSNRTRQWP